VIGDESQLRLQTIIGGEMCQDTFISDLLFGCAELVSYFSTGTTLQRGNAIITGTPGGKFLHVVSIFDDGLIRANSRPGGNLGVGNGLKPPRFLQPGNRMEVKISQIGILKNVVEFE
jgi:2-keto-4-pentenoate hydratase/2-oxohepta-3-ene-1,7-dioic acid hydratase in catechol pathway